MRAKIYYFTLEGVTSTVFDSQVASLVNYLKDENLDVELIVGQKLRSRFISRKFFQYWLDKNSEFFFIKNKKIRYENLAIKLLKILERDPSDNIILHCRNIEAAYVGYILKTNYYPEIEVIYDVRGYVEGEKEFFGEYERQIEFERLNQKLFRSVKYFNFVSNELLACYNLKYQFSSDFRYTICNSFFNDKVFKILKTNLPLDQNKLEIKPKVIFIGGNQGYQKVDQIINVFKNIESADLTIVTNRPISENTSDNKITFLHGLNSKELNSLLDEYDYGIIWRDQKMFNKVATPTKVAEYLGKGLHVLAIESSGSFDSLFKMHPRLGSVIRSSNQLLNFDFEKTSYPEKLYISNYAKNELSLTANASKYLKLYDEIISGFKKGS